MIKELKWAYHYAVHVPHRESDWKLGFILSMSLVAAIAMNF